MTSRKAESLCSRITRHVGDPMLCHCKRNLAAWMGVGMLRNVLYRHKPIEWVGT